MWLARQLEDMLSKLQPHGAGSTQADRDMHQGDEVTTAALHETTGRLHDQHLSGQTEGADGPAFMTPAGARWPQGRSPVDRVNFPQ